MMRMNVSAKSFGLAILGATVLALPSAAQSFSVSGAGGLIPAVGTGNGAAGYPTTLPIDPFVSGVAVGLPVANVTKVKIDGLAHTWVGDVSFILVDPTGKGYNLISRPGRTSSGFGNQGDYLGGNYEVVDPSTFGALVIPETGNIAAGTYAQYVGSAGFEWPNGNANVFNDALGTISGPAGTWELRAYDWENGDSGVCTGWTLEGNNCTPVASVWSQSADHTLVAGTGIACTNNVSNADNAILRSYNPTAQGASGNFDITGVTYGVEAASSGGVGSQPGNIRLYSDSTPGGVTAYAELVLLIDDPITILDGSLYTATHTFSTPITFVNGGEDLVVEIFVPDSITPALPNLFFFGGNGNGQSGITSIASALCGIPDPLDLALIGFPNSHVVLDVNVVSGCVVPPPPPFTYCTAKLGSLGCLPAIGFTGTPSATSGSGFIVSSSNNRNRKAGLLLYTFAGQSSTPFGGGTLCVAQQFHRTVVQNSGGSAAPVNDCSGGYTVDMNLFAVGGLGGNPQPSLLVPGTVVDCQFFGRDPGFLAPDNISLSDALEYTIGA